MMQPVELGTKQFGKKPFGTKRVGTKIFGTWGLRIFRGTTVGR